MLWSDISCFLPANTMLLHLHLPFTGFFFVCQCVIYSNRPNLVFVHVMLNIISHTGMYDFRNLSSHPNTAQPCVLQHFLLGETHHTRRHTPSLNAGSLLVRENATCECSHAEEIVNCGQYINTFMSIGRHCASQMT